ncbi:hypothetical protein [Acuticoccus sediminis]|nr:hypothetical protein [Acuticoccus sediminis]
MTTSIVPRIALAVALMAGPALAADTHAAPVPKPKPVKEAGR